MDKTNILQSLKKVAIIQALKSGKIQKDLVEEWNQNPESLLKSIPHGEMHLAARNKTTHLFSEKFLKENLHRKNPHGQPLLHTLIKYGDIPTNLPKEDYFLPDDFKTTTLQILAKDGRITPNLHYLLTYETIQQTNDAGDTILHSACQKTLEQIPAEFKTQELLETENLHNMSCFCLGGKYNTLHTFPKHLLTYENLTGRCWRWRPLERLANHPGIHPKLELPKKTAEELIKNKHKFVKPVQNWIEEYEETVLQKQKMQEELKKELKSLACPELPI